MTRTGVCDDMSSYYASHESDSARPLRARGDNANDAKRVGWGRIAAVSAGVAFVACGASVVQQLGGVRETARIVRGHYLYARANAGAYGEPDAYAATELGAAWNSTTMDVASLGACTVSSGSAVPQYCALPETAVRTCDYTSSCLPVPVCDFGDLPVGGKGACKSQRVCAPQICAPRICAPTVCCGWKWRGKCKKRCGGGCTGGGCTPGPCTNVDIAWKFTCRRARPVTTGKCTTCAPFFVARESNTKCIVDPSLTAAYDASVGAVNNAKNAVQNTIDDINDVVSDLMTTIPNKANEITSAVSNTITGIPDLVEDVVNDLIKAAFPSDAKDVLKKITSVFTSASLGAAPMGNGKHDHFGHVLNQERVRKLLRNKLRGTTEKVPEYTALRENAHLGSCSAPKMEISLPLDEILPESVLDLSYDMPWPEKLGDSPFAPATLKAGFPEPTWTMGFEIRDFSFPEAVATNILAAFFAFFEPLFNSIGDGVTDVVNDAKNAVMSPINSLTGVVNDAKNAANSVKNSLDSAMNALGGRKLLSTEEASHYQHLHGIHTQATAHFALIEQQHDMLLDRIENHVMLQVAKIRTALAEDPWLERPGTMAQFPHLRARLGDPLTDGANAAKTKLIDAMKSLKDFTMTAVLYMRMHIEFKVEAEAEAFMAGDVLDLVDGVPKSVSFEGEFPIPMTPFTMRMSMGAGISLPYFLMAKATGVFSYTADLTGMEVGFTVANGGISAVLPDPGVALTPFLDANLEAHAQLGVVAEVTDLTAQLCVAGMVCSGPKTTAEQRIYLGADMAAQATTGEASCAAMQAQFNDNFVYTDAYIASKCKTANFAGVQFAIGLGAYVQVPKTDLNIVLKTDVDINGVSICVDDVQLYTWPPEPGNFYLKML